jgi:hypothetical protein
MGSVGLGLLGAFLLTLYAFGRGRVPVSLGVVFIILGLLSITVGVGLSLVSGRSGKGLRSPGLRGWQ